MNAEKFLKRALPRNSSPENRYVSPNGSPYKTPTKYQLDGGDRYLPLREHVDRWSLKYVTPTKVQTTSTAQKSPLHSQGENVPVTASHSHRDQSSPNSNSNQNGNENNQNEEQGQGTMVQRAILMNEMLSHSIVDIRVGRVKNNDHDGSEGIQMMEREKSESLLKFTHKTPTKAVGVTKQNSTNVDTIFSRSPLSRDSRQLLSSPKKPQRKVPKNPYKVLDAPELQDDFYLNLVDWSSMNMLSVGLASCVYLWSACNSSVTKLCDLASEQDMVTSVQWSERGDYLGVGTSKGILQIWDTHAQKKIHELPGHTSRVGCLAWNGETICSGSRDRLIIHRDLRRPNTIEKKMSAHRQEVCGLKWSPNKEYLASGGNDNQLLIWSLRRPEPVQTHAEHNAAVKALAWSPHHHGVLVSGGGTADRSLRFWNTLTGQAMQCVETGSQVCNVAWSKHSSELVSTHGYSQNQVILWKYPSMQPIVKLQGHQLRVLYLAMSPDGESIVTGAGDETLRFWHVFSKTSTQRSNRSALNLLSLIR